MVSPPAPIPGSAAGGSSMSAMAEFIKHHYPEIALAVIGIYLAYVLIVEVSKFIVKPAYLIDHHRGTKRYIGRTFHSKIVVTEDPTLPPQTQEFRAFIKDGLFRPISPYLFIDMDRVNVGVNYILLDYRAVVYDHGRRMFVGSLTGAKDIDLDGESVTKRTKDKLSMIDVLVSMSVKGCANVAQFNYLNNAIPIGDGLYEENKERPRLRGDVGLPPDVVDPPSHLDDVMDAKAMKDEMKNRPVRPIRKRRVAVRGRSIEHKRFTVGSPDDEESGDEPEEPEEPDEPIETPSGEISESETEPDFESMSLGDKFGNIFKPKLTGSVEEDWESKDKEPEKKPEEDAEE